MKLKPLLFTKLVMYRYMECQHAVGSRSQMIREEHPLHRLMQLAHKPVPGLDHGKDGIVEASTSSLHQTLDVQRRHSISICWPSSSEALQQRTTTRAVFGDEEAERRFPFHEVRLYADAYLPRVQLSLQLHSTEVNDRESARDRFLHALRTQTQWQNSSQLQLGSGRLSIDDGGLPASEGPKHDVLKPSDEAELPENKTSPFLLRFPISAFGICLGVGSQSILWKTLAKSPSTEFLGISQAVNELLWCATLVLLVAVSMTYTLKAVFYFEAVHCEFTHPVRANFFFAPWVACLFLFLGLPPAIPLDFAGKGAAAVWYVLMAPILCLELKIYGQWMSRGQRRLSKVANPSSHLSIVGNFVGALLGASLGLKEGPIFFFSVGLAHYVVLLVTLYQRLPTSEALPKELHPVFFLFVAVPTVASMAWTKIHGTFDYVSRMPFFLGLFLYASLAVRINFFRGFRFSLAWWAYTFPMTDAAVATIWYASEVTNLLTESLSLVLSAVSTLTMVGLLISTIHAFVFGNLFPYDLSIAVPETGGMTCGNVSVPFPSADGEPAVAIEIE